MLLDAHKHCCVLMLAYQHVNSPHFAFSGLTSQCQIKSQKINRISVACHFWGIFLNDVKKKNQASINISLQLSKHLTNATQMTGMQRRARHAFRHKCNRTNATLCQILSVQVCCMRACNANALTLCPLRISAAALNACRAAFTRTIRLNLRNT